MALNEETKVEEKLEQEQILDLNIPSIKKSKFRINGDANKVLELNISDMGIVKRLNRVYPKLQALAKKATTFDEKELNDNSDEALEAFANKLDDIDQDMRKLVDELFQSNVSELCCDDGTMYDLYGGMMRFEHIIETLAKLYENNFSSEFSKARARIQKHTSKYTG